MNARIVEALQDMLAGWKYIRQSHGDLYGVGWDRAQEKAETALAEAEAQPDTVPWPVVTQYSGGASPEGVAGRVWIRLSDEGLPVEYVPAKAEAQPVQEPIQVWCDTCEGTGMLHQESQHGVTGSGCDFPCPDCDGKGFNVRAAPPQPVPLSAEPVSAWQPIATAPTDGRPVWVRGNNFGDELQGWHCCWAWWDGHSWRAAGDGRGEDSELLFLVLWLPFTTQGV